MEYIPLIFERGLSVVLPDVKVDLVIHWKIVYTSRLIFRYQLSLLQIHLYHKLAFAIPWNTVHSSILTYSLPRLSTQNTPLPQ